eukprot:scaffold33535_cov29-Tisochrysis_lutea.AAC.4
MRKASNRCRASHAEHLGLSEGGQTTELAMLTLHCHGSWRVFASRRWAKACANAAGTRPPGDALKGCEEGGVDREEKG